jgi:hypothetical protein
MRRPALSVLLYNIVTSIRRRSSALHTNKCTYVQYVPERRELLCGGGGATFVHVAYAPGGGMFAPAPREASSVRESRERISVCILYARRLIFSNTARIRPHNKLPPGDFTHTEAFVYSPRAHHRLNGAYTNVLITRSSAAAARSRCQQFGGSHFAEIATALWRHIQTLTSARSCNARKILISIEVGWHGNAMATTGM